MKTIVLNVQEEYVAGAGVIAGASGSADSTAIHVIFSEDWDGLSKYATTRNSRGESATVTALTTDKLVEGTLNEYLFTIPQTAMAYEGQMTVTFTGYEVVDGNEISTITNTATANLRVLPSDWTDASDGSITPTLYEQLQAEIDTILADISDARAAATEAETSASNAATSESNASTSETNASASATLAESYAKGGTYTRGGEDTDNSKYYSEQASASASNAATSESNASTSESNASASATASESYAKGGTNTRSGEDTDNAKYYKEQADSDASSASSSASTATTQATKSESYAVGGTNSRTGEDTDNAKYYKEQAATSASNASTSASNASTSETNASTYATTSKSYSVGGTATRQDEETDNAHYYYEQCKTIAESLNEGLVPSGTLAFENLPSLSVAVTGAMYNVSNEFTTTSDFEEGAGRVIPAGTNIYKTNNNKWDVLAGSPVTGIKGDSELDYRRGNVNITKANIGLGNVDNTSDSAKSTAFGTFTSSDETSNPSWISQNKFESDTVQNNFGELSKTVNNTRYLKNHLDSAESNISTNASNISTNASNIATNTSNISANATNISALSGNFATSVETTNTAVSAHAQNSYFVWKGAFVKATTAISVGDTISSSNTSATNILSALSATSGAGMIGFTPPTGMSATNVQGAIEEVVTDLNDLNGLASLHVGNITASTELDYVKAVLDWCATNVPPSKLRAIDSTWFNHDFGVGTVHVTGTGAIYLTLSYGSHIIYRARKIGTTNPTYSCYKITGTAM